MTEKLFHSLTRIPFLLGIKGKIRFLKDESYLKWMYYLSFGRKLNLDDPKTFNEKLQWLKLNDRNPRYIQLVDKALAKEFVADTIGTEFIVPTLGVWNTFDDIDFGALPDRFVLKCTHDSGGIVICRDKRTLDYKTARRKIQSSLRRNYYWVGREWPYKNIKPRIIAEEYIEGASDRGLQDFKLFCFNGNPEIVLVCSNRFSKGGLNEDFFDLSWNHLPMSRAKHSNLPVGIPKPNRFEDLIVSAGKLAQGTPFSRIDFLKNANKFYFGEITFYPASGFEGFLPEEWDDILGSMIVLPDGHA